MGDWGREAVNAPAMRMTVSLSCCMHFCEHLFVSIWCLFQVEPEALGIAQRSEILSRRQREDTSSGLLLDRSRRSVSRAASDETREPLTGVSSKVQALTINVRIFGHPAIATDTEALPLPPHLPLGQLIIDIALQP